ARCPRRAFRRPNAWRAPRWRSPRARARARTGSSSIAAARLRRTPVAAGASGTPALRWWCSPGACRRAARSERRPRARHRGPAPGIEVKAHRGEGLDLRAGRDAVLGTVARILAAHHVRRSQRTDAAEDLDLLVAKRVRALAHRWLHRQVCDHLQQMVLDHVAD